MAKVWIINDRNNPAKVEQVDSKKLIEHEWSPAGMCRFKIRAPSKYKPDGTWEYVYYGETREEVCAKYNKRYLERIAKLEAELAKEKERLLT